MTGPVPSVIPGSGPGPRIRRRPGPSRAWQCKGGDSDKAQSKESQTMKRGLPGKPGWWVNGEDMGTCRGVEKIAAYEDEGVLCPASGEFERAALRLQIWRVVRRVVLSKIEQIFGYPARSSGFFLDARPAR